MYKKFGRAIKKCSLNEYIDTQSVEIYNLVIMTEERKRLLSQVSELFGRVVYSHKTHEKQIDIFISHEKIWKWAQIISTVLTSTSYVTTLFSTAGFSKAGATVSIVLSIISFAISMRFFVFNVDKDIDSHKTAAIELWDIRESYLSLIVDLRNENINIEEIKKKRDLLQDKTKNVYSKEPRTTSKAYKQARDALKINEELTFSKEELNVFLPKELQL